MKTALALTALAAALGFAPAARATDPACDPVAAALLAANGTGATVVRVNSLPGYGTANVLAIQNAHNANAVARALADAQAIAAARALARSHSLATAQALAHTHAQALAHARSLANAAAVARIRAAANPVAASVSVQAAGGGDVSVKVNQRNGLSGRFRSR